MAATEADGDHLYGIVLVSADRTLQEISPTRRLHFAEFTYEEDIDHLGSGEEMSRTS